MKIGQPSDTSIHNPPANAAANQRAGQAAVAGNAPAANAASGSRSAGVAVTVSTMARGLEKAGSSTGADIDTQKVAAIRSAIQDGTYVVNPEAIADKLLSNAQEMLNRPSR